MPAPSKPHLNKHIIRFPDGMRDRIKAAAEVPGRSMNAEIVHRLERSFALEGSPHEFVAAQLDDILERISALEAQSDAGREKK